MFWMKYRILALSLCVTCLILTITIITYRNATSVKINKVYIVNGLQYPIRYQNTVNITNSLGFKDVIKFPAIYPKSKTVYDEINKTNYECSLRIGEIGCILSHRKLWNEIQQISNNNWNIIFEDDIILPLNLTYKQVREKIDNMLKNAQNSNVDVVYFGNCLSDLCTHAYAIRPSAAKLLYENTYDCILGDSMKPYDKGKQLPIDVQMRILKNNKIIKCMYSPNFKHKKEADYPRVKGLINQKTNSSTIQI